MVLLTNSPVPFSRVKGSVFRLQELAQLDPSSCNLLFLSDSSLYLAQRFARNEVNFLSRYAENITDNGRAFDPLDLSNEAGVDLAQEVARVFRYEVSNYMSIQVLVDAIDRLTVAVSNSSCGCEVGQGEDTDSPPETGGPPQDIGPITYGAPDPIADRKCKAAHWIYDNALAIFTNLDNNNVDTYSGLTLGLMLTLIGAAVGTAASPVFGTLLGAVVGALAGIAAKIIGANIDLGQIVTILTSEQASLICAMYDSSNAESARTAIMNHLDTTAMSVPNKALVELLLTNSVLNILYFSSEDSEAEVQNWPTVVDCSTCAGQCQFSYTEDDRGYGPGAGSGSLASNGVQRTISSQLVSGKHRIKFELPSLDIGCQAVNRRLTIHSVSGWSSAGNNTSFAWCSDSGNNLSIVWDNQLPGGSLPPNTGTHDLSGLFAVSDTAWSMEVTIPQLANTPPC